MKQTRTKTRFAPAVLMVVAAMASSASAGASAGSSSACDGAWHVQAAPENHRFQELSAATSTSSRRAWAIGLYADPPDWSFHPLIDSWDGSAWTVAPTVDVTGGVLYGVSASSSSDVWAVGDIFGGGGRTLAEHWNGTKWNVVRTPGLGKGSSGQDLWAVAAIGPRDAWAVGDRIVAGGLSKAQAIHWNGTKWRRVKVPNPPGDDTVRFTAVTAISSADAWAIGWRERQSDRIVHTLAEHWDGTAWSIVPTPNASINSNQATSISAVASDDVWMAGTYLSDSGSTYYPLTEHWDGSTWTVVPTAEPDTARAFGGIAAPSSALAWAVGGQLGEGGPSQVTLVERWNGSTWSAVASESPGTAHSALAAVTAPSSTRAWAVGHYTNNDDSKFYALIEHYC